MHKQSLIKRDSISLRHHIRVRQRRYDSIIRFLTRTGAAQIHLAAAFLFFGCAISMSVVTANKDLEAFVSTLLYGLCSVLLFSASACMHFLSEGFRVSNRFAKLLEDFDKFAIYLLIASTYTAVVVNALPPKEKFELLAIVWAIAIVGVIYTFYRNYLPKYLSTRYTQTGLFLLMGWTIIFYIDQVWVALSPAQLIFTFSGGAFYTIGAVFYVLERPNITRYFGYHELWHLLVVLGNLAYFLAVLLFYL